MVDLDILRNPRSLRTPKGSVCAWQTGRTMMQIRRVRRICIVVRNRGVLAAGVAAHAAIFVGS